MSRNIFETNYSNKVYKNYKEFIQEKLETTFEAITDNQELWGETNKNDIDYQPSSGFLPFTNSGFIMDNYTSFDMILSTDNFPAFIEKKLNNRIEEELKVIRKNFISENKEEIEKCKIEEEDFYSSLAEHNQNLADLYSNCEHEHLGQYTITFELGIAFYEADNCHNMHKNNSVKIWFEIEEIENSRIEKSFEITDNFHEDVEKALKEIEEKYYKK